ncbi:MAG: hypothetical protein L0215_04400 [Gemmataceae bacterium]|nr:hypothetical protein [Gemmataceae bacterium]
MTLHILRDPPPAELARALAEFERQFTYPLGQGRSFSISHGDDYPRFFRAMGDAASLVLEENGRVLGSLGIAIRRILLPEGRRHTVAYFGDLKVDPVARKAFAFLQLAWAADKWLHGKASAGFGVVMDGTRVTPDAYTGRFGIPAARVLGKTIVWQFPCAPGSHNAQHEIWRGTPQRVEECYRRLSRGRYACPGADPAVRSEMTPVWLLQPGGLACGLVEDTRRCKRLLADDGTELRSGHLSFFAWQTPAAGAALLDAALGYAGRAGHPALFVAVAPEDAPALEAALGPREKIVAPATVFGHGLDDEILWNINTAEI